MTLVECYAALGGDYDDVLARLGSPAMVQKFALKFLNDPSFSQLCAAMETGDGEAAFRAAHTLKGVCQNLGLTLLGKSSDALTDLLRGGSTAGTQGLFAQVQADYAQTVTAIQAFRDTQES